MQTLYDLSAHSNNLETIRRRADALGRHPNASEAINGLSRIIVKTCERIRYDPDAGFAAVVFFDRLERLASGERFNPAIYRGAFSASRRGA